MFLDFKTKTQSTVLGETQKPGFDAIDQRA